MPAVDVVVVGAGIAGLVLARDLALQGRRVVVLEAEDVPGGCVASHVVAGLRLDAGAESFATRSPAVRDLVEELGLGDDVVLPRPLGAWTHLPGRTPPSYPLPRAGMLGIPASPWAPDVRAVIGLLGALRASADRLLPARVGLGDGAGSAATAGSAGSAVGAGSAAFAGSAASPGPWASSARHGSPGSLGRLVRVRLGRRVLERLVAPVVSGVHSAHPDEVDLDTVVPGLRAEVLRRGSLGGAVTRMRAAAPAGAAVAGLRGGMNRLVSALVDDLTARDVEIRTGCRVEGVERADLAVDVAPGHAADRWRVTFEHGGSLTAPTVVLAVPGPAAVWLLRGTGTADAVAPVETDVILATLVLDAPALDAAPRGTGLLVAEERSVSPAVEAGPRSTQPRVQAKALTHGTAKWDWLDEAAGAGRHVLRLSYGRAGEQRAAESRAAVLRSPAVRAAERQAAAQRQAERLVDELWTSDGGPTRTPAPAASTTARAGVHDAGLGVHEAGPEVREAGVTPEHLSDAELQSLALTDASLLLGVPLDGSQVVGFARTRWATGLPHARPGHRERVAAVRSSLAAAEGLWACGAWLAGTGLSAVIADSRQLARQIAEASDAT
ncbi:FAD-dependent oxidoreductase [Actinotalea sp. K2]|uniref:protoporphyrinogen/coproporphyrinogen oxidase n=1 Tax=Actinotalea sp. K2 TaxID=2939438 RepID=UPI002017E90D|nr:FAD-dependent oxidoreductase [Actinotalea sp. K2]MCL3861641.1 FAD-dependent oxidoreductase [Actinotalea sp. K2]